MSGAESLVRAWGRRQNGSPKLRFPYPMKTHRSSTLPTRATLSFAFAAVALVSRALVSIGCAAIVPPTDNTTAPFLSMYEWSLVEPASEPRRQFAENWLNRNNRLWATEFLEFDKGSWSGISGTQNESIMIGLSRWAENNPDATLVLSLPMLPGTPGAKHIPALGTTLASGAAGAYNSHFQTLAQRLVARNLAHRTIIRVGWEFNGDWYPWRVNHGNADINPATGQLWDDRPANFVGFFRQIVDTMRAVPSSGGNPGGATLRFCWNGNTGWAPYDMADAYPGDNYVDYVGVDVYDQSWQYYPWAANATAQQIADARRNAWEWSYFGGSFSGGTSNNKAWWWRNFAASRGKPFAIPEWGLNNRTDTRGGLDNPDFIQRMYNFIHETNNNVAFHCYFDVNMDSNNRHQINAHDGYQTLFPLAAARFKQLFGLPMPVRTSIGPITAAVRADGATVAGAGTGFLSGATSDNFYYTSRTTPAGAGPVHDTFVARITSATVATGQAGVMLRQSTAAGSPYAGLFVSGGNLTFRSRTTADAAATAGITVSGVSLPVWLKLVRIGNSITGHRSTDGLNWTQVGSQTLALGGATHIGVAVASGASGTLNTVGVDQLDLPDFAAGQEGAIVGRIIKDNADATGVSTSGPAWTTSTNRADAHGGSHRTLTGNTAGSITFTPTIPAAGLYSVFLRWPADGMAFWDTVPVTINHAGGAATLVASQKSPMRTWYHAGVYQFAAGTVGNVVIHHTPSTAANRFTVADAVMFVPLPPAAGLPAPKVSADIGAPATPGAATFSGGVYSVQGAGGSDLDQFHYAYQTLTNNYQDLVARVTGVSNVHTGTTAGLMVRGSAAANAVYASVFVKPNGSIQFRHRASAGGSVTTGTQVSRSTPPSTTNPVWIKLEKSGVWVNAYYSTSVSTPGSWVFLGSANLSALTSPYLGGMSVHSHVAGTLATGTFDNVSP